MQLSDTEKHSYTERLLLARMRILCSHGFYGLLLMHMRFALDESVGTAATDGMSILFAPAFLKKLTDRELDFVLMHEVLHAALQHCSRGEHFQHLRYNIAADIVVNSTILKENNMDLHAICLAGQPSMHLTPNGKEGHLYTAEEVYMMLPKLKEKDAGSLIDNHDGWCADTGNRQHDVWKKRIADACRAMEGKDGIPGCGSIPAFAKRMWQEMTAPKTDWRTILHDFVQEEICDYSFFPPDRRYPESDFFLPDYNETEETLRDILFMVDTSGSIADKELDAVYGELCSAMEQFQGKLRGKLGFFDADVKEPMDFSDKQSLQKIQPVGGGGTSFHAVFSYVQAHMQENPPAVILIFTDGLADFPEEQEAMGIPVLWLINNDFVTPPWGKTARMNLDD